MSVNIKKIFYVLLINLFLIIVGTDLVARLVTVVSNKDLSTFTAENTFYRTDNCKNKYSMSDLNPFLLVKPFTEKPFNALGIRTVHDVLERKGDNEIRLFFFGGSTTANIALENSFSNLIEEELKKVFPDLQIKAFNVARDGWATTQSLVRLATDIVYYKPDLNIIMHGTNDIHALFFDGVEDVSFLRNAKYFHPRYFPSCLLERTVEPTALETFIGNPILNKHRALNLIFSRIDLSLETGARYNVVKFEQHVIDKGVREFSTNLKSFAALTESLGANTIIFGQPIRNIKELYNQSFEKTGYRLNYPTFEQFQNIVHQYIEAGQKVSENCGRCDFINVFEKVRGLNEEKRIFRDNVHYTEEGVKIFTQQALSEMIENVCVVIEKRNLLMQEVCHPQ